MSEFSGVTEDYAPRIDAETPPSLLVTAPPDLRGERFQVTERSVTLGGEGDLVVAGIGVSRRHARVWRADGSTWIEDAGSTNGTVVNDTRITGPVTLQTGDIVKLGEVEVQFTDGHNGGRASHASASAFPTMAPHADTTRFLCAACHLDEDFSDHVIAALVDEPYRAVAPSYGVDLPAVAKHAVAARRRRLGRDAALVVLLVALVAVVSRSLVSSFRSEEFGGDAETAARAVRDALWPAMLLLAPALLVVAAERWIARALVLPKLALGRSNPNAIRPPFSRRIRRRVQFLADSQTGNVVVFSGFKPFVGSGGLFDSWSFAVDVTRGQVDPETGERRRPQSFEAEELHATLSTALERLGLLGLHVGERLFVDGTAVASDRRLLPNRLAPPVTHVEPSIVRESLRNPDGAARTYLCLEAIGWDGHLVVTIFVRAVRLPGSLFVEASSFALLPLRDEYYAIDTLPLESKAEAGVAALGKALLWGVPRLLVSPVRLLRTGMRALAAASSRRHERSVIEDGWRFDYGATTGIREEATGVEHNRYFLLLDHQMYVKVAYERILRAIGRFLDDHDIDTGDFANRQTVINQSNTVNANVSGGTNVVIGGRDAKGVVQPATGAASAKSGSTR